MTCSANRESLFNEGLVCAFFNRVKLSTQWERLAGDEHFSVDGMLIEAWASHKSVRRDDDGNSAQPPGRNSEVGLKGQQRCNDTHQSTTYADARLFKKAQDDDFRLCHMGHTLVENRHRLIMDVEITHASGTTERESTLKILGLKAKNQRATVGVYKGYDCKTFIKG